MNQLGFPLLSALIFLPVAGAVVIAVCPRSATVSIRAVSLLAAVLDLCLGVMMLSSYRLDVSGLRFVEQVPWISSLGIQYWLGLDGVSLFLVALTTLLTLVALGGCWPQMGVRAKEYGVFLLLLEAGVIGALVAQDLVLFFVFWEIMLLPLVLLIGICGGSARIAASMRFFLYTSAGSLMMLLGIIVLFAVSGGRSFGMADLLQAPLSRDLQGWLFLAFAIAFAIKIPIFPFHTWLPGAYGEAPIPSLVLGTMLTKVGAYGFLRICLPLFPSAMADWTPVLSILAVVGVLYGSLVALAQRDLIRLLAYSSMAHLGFIVLGAFALNLRGISGSILQMVNHGITTGALFLVAAMLVRRAGSRNLDDLGGAASRWPVLAGFLMLSGFASLGAPGLNGFVGEFLVLLGAFQQRSFLAIVGALGVILSAAYILWMIRRAMHGPVAGAVERSQDGDLNTREVVLLAPLAALMVIIGLFPTLLLGQMEPSVSQLLTSAQRRVAAVSAFSDSEGLRAGNLSTVGLAVARRDAP